MKLKYYLRGLGLGIVCTTIILMISFWSHKNDISDEEVISRAKKLGMVMQEENDSILNRQTSESVTDTENVPDTQVEDTSGNVQTSQQTNKNSKNNGGWRQFDTQADTTVPENTTTPSSEITDNAGSEAADKKAAADTTAEAAGEKEKSEESDNKNSEKENVTIKITKGEGCRLVAEELMAQGLIEDSEDFRKYMDSKNLDNKLRVGEFSIPKGSTYEQIAKMIAN